MSNIPKHEVPIPTKKPSKKKSASKFFTEYYSAAFLFLISLFVVLAFFFLKPVIDTIKQTNAKTRAEIATAASEQSYLNSLETSISAAKTISPAVLQRVEQALPTKPNIPSLLVQFGSAAYANAVKIDSLAFSESKPLPKAQASVMNGMISPVDITLSLHAHSYFDIKRFLADLETSLRVMDVVGITSGGSGGTDVYYNLQLRTYVFSGPTVPTTVK